MERFENAPAPAPAPAPAVRRGRPPKATTPKEIAPKETTASVPPQTPATQEQPPKVAYENYGIKRERKKPKRLFSFVLIGVVLALVVLVANLVLNNAIFGIFNAATIEGERVTLEGINFWAVEAEQFENKNAALASSRAIIKQGGAGYVHGEEGKPYLVLCCIYCEKAEADSEWGTIDANVLPNARIREFSATSREVSINCCHDKEMFEGLTNSFRENFNEMCSRLIALKEKKTTAKEISGWALFTYNNLQQRAFEFGKIQENAKSVTYSKVLMQVNKQLLALYQLAYEGESANYTSVLKNTMCSVAFAYIELLTAL